MNVYGRSRWERKAELVDSIAQRVNSGPEIEADSITEAERAVAGLKYPLYSNTYNEGFAGSSPVDPAILSIEFIE